MLIAKDCPPALRSGGRAWLPSLLGVALSVLVIAAITSALLFLKIAVVTPHVLP